MFLQFLPCYQTTCPAARLPSSAREAVFLLALSSSLSAASPNGHSLLPCSVGLVGALQYSFYLWWPENVISISCWKDTSSEYRMMGWQWLSFSSLKFKFHDLLAASNPVEVVGQLHKEPGPKLSSCGPWAGSCLHAVSEGRAALSFGATPLD